jgi:hypothetical protein
MTIPGVFSIIVGVGMIGQWSLSFAAKQIPELATEPIRIWFHIVGEMGTAVLLVISGVGLLSQTTWAPALFLVSAGMLIYTAIVSPGYFAQKGQWIWVLIFGVIITITVVSIILVSGKLTGCSPV